MQTILNLILVAVITIRIQQMMETRRELRHARIRRDMMNSLLGRTA